MKKFFVGLTLTAAIAANAQTTTTSAPAAPAAKPAATQPAVSPAPTQVLTTEAQPSLKDKFGAIFYSENSMGVKEQQNLKDKAGITTAWTMGLKYKPTKAASVELQQIAYTRSNLEGDVDKTTFTRAGEGERHSMGDLIVKGNLKTELTLAGSEKIGFSSRFYLPTSETTRDVLKRNGVLRFDVNPSWVINPLVTIDWVNSPRIIFNKESSSVGSDTVYRYVGGVGPTLNFSDAFNAYYLPYVDIRSSDISRGSFTTEKLNTMYHEVGLNYIVGPLTINPAIETVVSLNDRSASVLTADSRVFADENMSYLLNFYASF